MWIPLLCADTLRGTTFRRVVIARARWGSENQRASDLRDGALLVSVAAGISTQAVEQCLAHRARFAFAFAKTRQGRKSYMGQGFFA